MSRQPNRLTPLTGVLETPTTVSASTPQEPTPTNSHNPAAGASGSRRSPQRVHPQPTTRKPLLDKTHSLMDAVMSGLSLWATTGLVTSPEDVSISQIAYPVHVFRPCPPPCSGGWMSK
jgi:hypothetical protein